MILLALDPSIRSAGAALLRCARVECASASAPIRETWELVACARVTLRSADTRGARCLAMAHQVVDWVGSVGYGPPDRLAFEWPQIYRTGRTKADPNDLPALAGVGCAVAGILSAARAGLAVLAPTPAEWSGQVPKATTGDPWDSPRGHRVASRLSAAERAVVPAQHDALDAAAIGLWAVGRFDRRRVFPGAT